MSTITGLTASRMLEIEAASIVDGEVVADNLILTRQDGTPIDAGNVRGPQGPAGPTGPAGTSFFIGQMIEMTGGNPDATRLIAADGGAYLKTDWPALDTYYAAAGYPHGSTATHFNTPDKRERVSIGTSAGTAVGVNDGVSSADRQGRRTRHRHTPHTHSYSQSPGEPSMASGGISVLRNPSTQTTGSADGGSGVATDPLDGPAYIASNFYIFAKV